MTLLFLYNKIIKNKYGKVVEYVIIESKSKKIEQKWCLLKEMDYIQEQM